jgi:membrane protein
VIVARYREVHGRETAAAITLYGFFALFAVSVLGIALLGFVAAGNRHLASQLVGDLGVHGTAARTVTRAVDTARSSRHAATAIGVLGLGMVGTTFASTVANAYDTAWGVSHRAIRARLVGLVWLLGAGVLLAAGGYLTSALSFLPAWLAPLVVAVSIAVDTAMWLWTSYVLPNRRAQLRVLLPAAVLGGVAFETLKVAGGYAVPPLVVHASALYGTLGAVFALITWLWLFGRLVVIVTILETVRLGSSDEATGVGEP